VLRGLEPEDRIRELGDASVPFRFAKYALILTAVSRSWSGRWGRLLGKPTVPGGLAHSSGEFSWGCGIASRSISVVG